MLNNPILTNILLIIVLLTNIMTMIFVVVSMKRNKPSKGLVKEYQMTSVQTAAAGLGSGSGSGSDQGRGYADSGVVFCRNCGTQYDSANSACPRCKTAR